MLLYHVDLGHGRRIVGIKSNTVARWLNQERKAYKVLAFTKVMKVLPMEEGGDGGDGGERKDKVNISGIRIYKG